ncbi:hypothetical protein ACLQ3F_29255 [Micromonospora sp. DT15]|uniref:hypothetical protein n=1 Tax=Micromonospora sp. DT15 TaxID=3393445 RepID=UPI003CF99726
MRVRTATAQLPGRLGRGPTRIVVGIDAVGESKARVNVLHEKLTGAEQAAELKVLLETDGDHR